MAARLFGAAVDYARVRLYHRRYPPFGLQPVNCAMTPNASWASLIKRIFPTGAQPHFSDKVILVFT